MVQSFGDIALGTKSIIVAESIPGYGDEIKKPAIAVDPNPMDTSQSPWSPWGANNLMPAEIADDIENCGVLAAALDAKARIGTGKGMQPFLLTNVTSDGKEELEWVSDSEIHDWLELNEGFEFAYDSSFDKHAYGWNCGSFVLNRKMDKIYRVKRHDVYEARLEKKDRFGRIKRLFLCADWRRYNSTFNPDAHIALQLLEEGNETADLADKIAGGTKMTEFSFINRSIRNGRQYYPFPLYRSGKAWIKIARSVPAFKNAMFKNQGTWKYLVTINPKFWEDKFSPAVWAKYTPEEKQASIDDYYNKIDKWLTGEDAAYKSLFTGGFMDPVKGQFIPYVTVEVLDDKMSDGKFLPESGAANSEILFALMINPALMGAGNPGGRAYGDTSGGSNVRESFLVQLMIMEAERRLNASVFNVVKNFNGWRRLEQEYTVNTGSTTITHQPRLVFRYPSGLLTTLDTGKSTKPENM